MKKMYVWATTCLMLAMVVLTSCSKKEDAKQNTEKEQLSSSIVGFWVNEEKFSRPEEQECYDKTSLRLNDDGSFVIIVPDYTNKSCTTEEGTGTYKVDGNVITLTGVEGGKKVVFSFVIKLSKDGKKMELSSDGRNTFYFKRK